MKTDIPLRTLTRTRPADLLPLLGTPDATVLEVLSLELPAVTTALDNLIHLRSPLGTVYFHLVEWQGYHDPVFLPRVLTYLGWLGQQHRGVPLAVTLIYLQPGDDVGDTLQQVVDGTVVWSVTFHCVRLWEQDAAAAVASGRPGLAVLSPLMANASADIVTEAVGVVLAGEEAGQRQANLLTILGVFAEPLLESNRYVRLVGRERLMASDLISYLVEERIAELEQERTAERTALVQERAALEQERAAERTTLVQERAALEQERAVAQAALAQMVVDTVAARFPTAPITLDAAIRQIRDPRRLQDLHAAILRAPDQASVERLLTPSRST